MNLEQVLKRTIKVAETAGSFIIEQGKDFSIDVVEKKGHQDYVSFVDKEAERILVEGLRGILPDSGFIAEENTAGHQNEKHLWIVDPLDGTTNFIHGVAPYAISIALQIDGKTALGLVYELGQKELFYSCSGMPVYCNQKVVSVSKADGLKNALIATGFHTSNFERLDQQLKVLKKIVEGSHGLRRHGSAATDLAYVAAGRFDGFFEYGLNPWDVAAGAFLVQQAGGIVSDYTGGGNYMFGKEMIAGSPKVHDDLLSLLKTKF
ncbi:MAG: inositol monophosphatase [Salinivirgaceae bacterium]